MAQIAPNIGKHRAIWKLLVWPPRGLLVCPPFGAKMRPKSGQTNNSLVAKLITLNLLLAAVNMRFWQNGGQTNNSQKGQKVDKLITLRHVCIYIYIYIIFFVCLLKRSRKQSQPSRVSWVSSLLAPHLELASFIVEAGCSPSVARIPASMPQSWSHRSNLLN